MKKVLLVMPLTAAIALTSCNLDNSDDIMESRQYITANLFSPEDPSTPASASVSTYKLTFYPNKGTVNIDAALKLNDKNHKLALVDVPSQYGVTNYGEIANFNSPAPVGTQGVAVKDLIGSVTPFVYYYKSPLANLIGTDMFSPRLIVSYKIEGVGSVITFPFDAFYYGNSIVETENQDGHVANFTTDGMVYRLNLQVAEKKATVIVYKARFKENVSDNDLIEALVFENLTVEYRHGGYSVSGSDVVPSIITSSGKQSAPQHTADHVSFTTSGQYLLGGNFFISFADGKSFTFSGKYIYDNSDSKQ